MMDYLFKMLVYTISIFIFIVFLKSSVSKIRNPYAFVVLLQEYNFFKNKNLLIIMSSILIVVEFICGFWLLIPNTQVVGVLVGLFLQITYLIMMIRNYGQTFEASCGCFEFNTPQKITLKNIIVNIVIMFLLILIIIFLKK